MINCPECDVDITISPDIVISEILQCNDCGVELEVTNLDPLTLEMAPEEDEDWGQ